MTRPERRGAEITGISCAFMAIWLSPAKLSTGQDAATFSPLTAKLVGLI
jgi:hypothetical protein